ncbi:MAG: acyl-CoA thioesterase [Phycisphaerales bacterium]
MPEPGFHTSLRVLMTPQDTNHQGTVFGGVILSRIDQAAYLEARRHGQHRWVTVSMERIEFKAPIWTGDIVDFDTKTESTGRSSVTVKVEVFAERYATGDRVAVTEASVKMVAVNAAGKSIDFRDPPTVGAAVRPERTG